MYNTVVDVQSRQKDYIMCSCLFFIKSPEMSILLIILLLTPALVTISASQRQTSGLEDKHNIQNLDATGKIYSGKELKAVPESVTVTEEVWFDFMIPGYYENGSDFRERVTIACFGALNPITCLNFISLAKGYTKGRTFMGYKGTTVQKIVRDFMVQLGDVKTKYSTGDSIFGTSFQDESFDLQHSRAGWVGMANYGPDTNGSQFYILLRSAEWLNNKHVVFGKVIEGMDAIQRIGEEETGKKNKPLREIIVENAGIVGIKTPYTLTAESLDTDEDIDTGSA